MSVLLTPGTGLNVAWHSSPTASKLPFYFLPFSCNQVNLFSESSQDIIKSSNQIIKLNHQIKSSKNHLHHVLSVPILVRRRKKNKKLFSVQNGISMALVTGRSLFRRPLSGTTFLPTSDTAVPSYSLKLLLKHSSSLLPSLSCLDLLEDSYFCWFVFRECCFLCC